MLKLLLQLCLWTAAGVASTSAVELVGAVHLKRDIPAGAIVTVKVLGDAPRRALAEAPMLVIEKGRLEPALFVVHAGQKFTLRNKDKLGYNLAFLFRADAHLRTAVLPESDRSYSFQVPEMFTRMSEDLNRLTGSVCVLEPAVIGYSLTAVDGFFKIPNLAPGKYVVEATTRDGRKARREIQLGASTASVEFDFVSEK